MKELRHNARALPYEEIVNLCGGKFGITDVPCPLCGPGRHSPHNRKRKVLRIWHNEPGFASFHCTRCDESGYAREGGAKSAMPKRLKQLRKKSAEREKEQAERQQSKAQYLWLIRRPIEGSSAVKYLRECRGYGGPLPATLGFLPPFKPQHSPAMIAAFGMAVETEPGQLLISDELVRGVHLTLLKPDGSAKAGTGRDKLMVGPSNGWPIVLAPMNDALGLIVCEGIETGLSLYEATGCGVWAAGSAGRMPALADKVPDYTDCVTVAAEPDTAGRKGAAELKKLLKARGLYCELRILGGEEAEAA
jgi:hypothetical protein